MCRASDFSPIENLKCHLMTRSARTSTLGGIVRPICLAAFRLMMNSNFFGWRCAPAGRTDASRKITRITALNILPLTNDNLVLMDDAVIEFFAGGIVMRYSVLLEPINEPEFQGYYYAHIPTLDLTTHGQGIEGAIAAAQELIEAWIGEKRSRGESVPIEAKSLIAQVEIPDALLRP
jgi:predicted RNase H-like HicB family nuclease